MDQREPPRINPSEGRPREPFADARGPRRFPRLVAPPDQRRLAPGPLVLAAAVALIGGGLLLATLYQLGKRAVRGLHAQPAYQLRFRDLTLIPDPPAWYRGGRAAFLDHVAAGAQEPSAFSTLDLDPARLRLSFRRDPWVEKAERVSVDAGAPGRVVVRLVYRQPVAVTLGDEVVIDREGVILPREDLDRPAAEPLIGLYNFQKPAGSRYGEVWNRVDPRTGVTSPDDQVQAAARLAAFVRGQIVGGAKVGNPLPAFVILRWRENGLALQVGPNLVFRWKVPDQASEESRFPDDTRWALLLDYLRRSPPRAADPRVELAFTRQGIRASPLRNEPNSGE